jgi:hypothetical protein
VIYLIVVSLNQPTLCPNATWNSNGTTLANNSTVGTYPYSVFVDINNDVYVAETSLNRIQMWPQGSVSPTRTITSGLNSPHSICVTADGTVYADSWNNGIVKLTANGTISVWLVSVSERCMGLFVDTNNTLYCSMDGFNRVVGISLTSGANTTTNVAGTGINGSASNMLYGPNGIVVDRSFSLYVADWGNNRIQKFLYGQLTATTVAGTGAAGTITLNGPTGVAVDANQYLFIADYGNNRIIGSGPNGFRCVVGCSGSSGSLSTQLYEPQNLGFDSYGNIYVADAGNSRIQLFFLINNTCTTSG